MREQGDAAHDVGDRADRERKQNGPSRHGGHQRPKKLRGAVRCDHQSAQKAEQGGTKAGGALLASPEMNSVDAPARIAPTQHCEDEERKA